MEPASRYISITTHTPSRSQDTIPQDGPPPTYHGQASKWKHQVTQSQASLGMKIIFHNIRGTSCQANQQSVTTVCWFKKAQQL